MLRLCLILISIITLWSCGSGNSTGEGKEATNAGEKAYNPDEDTLRYANEKHIRNVRQLTFGGDNAEAYFSFDDQRLVLQITNPDWALECDQIFTIDLNDPPARGEKLKMLSNGLGRTTCSYFMPGDSTILYASTYKGGIDCPPTPDRSSGYYVWPIYESFDIYEADMDGNIIRALTNDPGYDAEATVSPKGDKIVFTSMRSGDLELYTMNIDGSDVRQVTDALGYDGGAFFSPDGSKLIFRASRPQTEEEKTVYKDLLEQGLVQPTNMELYVCNVDGSDLTKITDLGNANWAPFFHPSGEKVIFSTNHKSERGFPFNLYMVNLDGTGLEQITFDDTFDSFPMFSNDGTKLVFASNRFNGGDRSTNVFIADWVE